MPWIVGIDEAGYGPNLGPLVMSSVACWVPDALTRGDLWRALAAVVRRGCDRPDERLLIDDSKVVYGAGKGLGCLEQQVLALLWRGALGEGAQLGDYVRWACLEGLEDLKGENWYRGDLRIPCEALVEDVQRAIEPFESGCAAAGVGPWLVRSVVVPTPRFNNLLTRHESKGGVLAHGLALLAREAVRNLPGSEGVYFAVDKHGGRNAYAAQIHDALPDGIVWAEQEGMNRSSYRVEGLSRDVRLTFQPRADAEHLPVALASMASKYLRETLMREFNRFWLERVPGLKPTAGYPSDALRFLEGIRAALRELGLEEAAVWRQK
jgi:hypothetical protein